MLIVIITIKNDKTILVIVIVLVITVIVMTVIVVWELGVPGRTLNRRYTLIP